MTFVGSVKYEVHICMIYSGDGVPWRTRLSDLVHNEWLILVMNPWLGTKTLDLLILTFLRCLIKSRIMIQHMHICPLLNVMFVSKEKDKRNLQLVCFLS